MSQENRIERASGRTWPSGRTWLAPAVLLGALSFGAAAPAEAQTPSGVIVVQAPPPQQVQYAPVVQYQQPYAQPVYTEPARRRSGGANLGLIISGAVLLGVGWIFNFIVGLPAGDDPFRSGAEPEWQTFRYVSLIPVAGPWVQLAVQPTSFDNDYWGVWLIIDGLLQAAGLTMLIAGIATSTDESDATADRGGGVELTLMPSIGTGHAGLTLAGRF